MTTGPQDSRKRTAPAAEDADEAAAARDEGIVEPESELAAGGHDDRQANKNDKPASGTVGDPDITDPEAGQP